MRGRALAAVALAALVAAVGCTTVRPERSASTASPFDSAPADARAPLRANGTSPRGAAEARPLAGQADVVRVPDTTLQLVVATTADWDSSTATVRLWQRARATAAWQPVGAAWPAAIGRDGSAWGRGAHGDGPPRGRAGPRKHEGDGKSPAGLFALGPSFGYAPTPPPGARLPYTTATASWRCVDDPASRYYNRLLDDTTVAPDWASHEDLRRPDELYRWLVEIEHNHDGNPGAGSCIFLHVWSGPDAGTAGCTAMDADRLVALLGQLDPAARPMFVLLPAADAAALAAPWGLPPP